MVRKLLTSPLRSQGKFGPLGGDLEAAGKLEQPSARCCGQPEGSDDMTCRERIAFALPWVMLGLAGCGDGFPNPKTPSYNLSVNPSLITVVAGSTTAFAAVFTPSRPASGSLTWSVNPAQGGSITSAGVYTASSNAGSYSVIATLTPTAGGGAAIRGAAAVTVLPSPQLGAELNIDLVQASGAIQVAPSLQNAAVVGQLVPYVRSVNSNPGVQVYSGFDIPVVCSASDRAVRSERPVAACAGDFLPRGP